MPHRNDIFEINIYHSARPVWHQIYILNKKAQLMVLNCIFLHLFHISRSTGFLKKKNNKRRKEKEQKKIPFINGMKVLKNNVGLAVPPWDPFILPPISFLSFFFFCSLLRCSLLKRRLSWPLTESSIPSPFWVYPALHNITLYHICVLSPFLLTSYAPWCNLCTIFFNAISTGKCLDFGNCSY